jgi:Rad3-related DNA helicase
MTSLGVRVVAPTEWEAIAMQGEKYWASYAPEERENLKDTFQALRRLTRLTTEKLTTLRATKAAEENYINCREAYVTNHGEVTTKLVRQPVDLTRYLRAPFKQLNTLVVTSATLNFEHMERELGVKPTHTIKVASPFNFSQNARLYIPKHLKRPGELGYFADLGREIVNLVQLSHGNALVLFTAKDALANTAGYIQSSCDLEYPLILQKDQSASLAFTRFMATPGSVLFGLKSFFEGIDVPGAKLRLVILTKLPFPHPEDPLVQAKQAQLGAGGWAKYCIPLMLTDVQQAAGRLIRTTTDRGVFAILDSRIWTGGRKYPAESVPQKTPWMGYGKNCVEQLPFKYTPRIDLIKTFFDDYVLPFEENNAKVQNVNDNGDGNNNDSGDNEDGDEGLSLSKDELSDLDE